jgi:hypothetical protein
MVGVVRKESFMFNLHSLLAVRLNAISGRLLATSATRNRRKAPRRSAHPGYGVLSAKLARASEQIRGARHGR